MLVLRGLSEVPAGKAERFRLLRSGVRVMNSPLRAGVVRLGRVRVVPVLDGDRGGNLAEGFESLLFGPGLRGDLLIRSDVPDPNINQSCLLRVLDPVAFANVVLDF